MYFTKRVASWKTKQTISIRPECWVYLDQNEEGAPCISNDDFAQEGATFLRKSFFKSFLGK